MPFITELSMATKLVGVLLVAALVGSRAIGAQASTNGEPTQTAVFEPLLADPKEPQFFATYLWARSTRLASRLGSVGFGQTIGVVRGRDWQGALAGGSEARRAARWSGIPPAPFAAPPRPLRHRPPRRGPGRQGDAGAQVAGGVEPGDGSRARRPGGRARIRATVQRPAQGIHRAGAVWGILSRLRLVRRCRYRVHAVTGFSGSWGGTACRTTR